MDETWTVLVAAIAVAIAILLLKDHPPSRAAPLPSGCPRHLPAHACVPISLAGDGIAIEGRVEGLGQARFLLDTGYVGPPALSAEAVLSAAGLTTEGRGLVDQAAEWLSAQSGGTRLFHTRFRDDVQGLAGVEERRSRVLVVPSLLGGPTEDVLVVHKGSIGGPHVLTLDWLLHRQPALVAPAAGSLCIDLPVDGEYVALRDGFHFPDAQEVVGGALVIVATVGGVSRRMLVDTGGASAAVTLTSETAPSSSDKEVRSAYAKGVTQGRVCSEVDARTVCIGPHVLERVEVATVVPSDGKARLFDGHVDGTLGMGLLRAFDLLFEGGCVGFRPNGLPTLAMATTRQGACPRN